MARILVVGAGGIGGIIVARLATLHEVDVFTRSAEVRRALKAEGLRVTGAGGDLQVFATCLDALPDQGSYDFVVIATQPPQVLEVAKSVAHLLGNTGSIVTIQNGLPESHVGKLVGHDRVVGCIVGWGASMIAPGVYDQTSKGAFTLSAEPRNDLLAGILEAVVPVKRIENFRGARWTKLAFNSAISTLGTIGGDTLGALVVHAFGRRLTLEVFTEVVAVTHAEGIELEKLAGGLDLEWMVLREKDRARLTAAVLAKHVVLLSIAVKYRRLRSSMLYALERGREPAVDFLNGEVIALGEKHGIPTPVNKAALDCVHAIHRGERTFGHGTLRALYDETR